MWKLTLLDPPLLPVELLLVIGGVFSILPGLEIWMLPPGRRLHRVHLRVGDGGAALAEPTGRSGSGVLGCLTLKLGV